MLHPHELTALATVAALLMYIGFALRVAFLRSRANMPAPAMTGDPGVERALRVQGNTLEWLVVFLPALWMFAFYWTDRLAALLGALWIAARLVYAAGYCAAAERRKLGFGLQLLITVALLAGSAAGALRVLMVTGV